MIAFLQFSGVLRGELAAVGIQNNQDRQTEPYRMLISRINVLVVLLVYINHDHYKIVL